MAIALSLVLSVCTLKTRTFLTIKSFWDAVACWTHVPKKTQSSATPLLEPHISCWNCRGTFPNKNRYYYYYYYYYYVVVVVVVVSPLCFSSQTSCGPHRSGFSFRLQCFSYYVWRSKYGCLLLLLFSLLLQCYCYYLN